MKRISNVNSFSAIVDRLIIENLKIIQFTDKNEIQKAEYQNIIIIELKSELDLIFNEIINNKYQSITEQRTYSSDEFFADLFKLCLSNYCIAKGDKEKIEIVKNNPIDLEKLKSSIEYVRNSLEIRANTKNNMEKIK
jgi:hypothetical protein